MTLPNPHRDKKKQKAAEILRKKQNDAADSEIQTLVDFFKSDLKRKALVVSTMNWDEVDPSVSVDNIREAARQLLSMKDGKYEFGFRPQTEHYLKDLEEYLKDHFEDLSDVGLDSDQ
jgi:hypothetical protein